MFAFTCSHAFCRFSLSRTCTTETESRECRSMTRRTVAPPDGFIALSEHIETSTHFYVRAFVADPGPAYYALC